MQMFLLLIFLIKLCSCSNGCAKFGCNCSDDTLRRPTFPCPQTNCYSNAICTKLKGGECGFVKTQKLLECLETQECKAMPCGRCAIDVGVIYECANSPIWECYNYGICGKVNGQCQWIETKEMQDCFNSNNNFIY